jgi:magnesium chelatase family protein
LSLQEALETTKIHSVAGKLPENATLVSKRPFRSPHHTISDVALVGGGGNPQPGEISLAVTAGGNPWGSGLLKGA